MFEEDKDSRTRIWTKKHGQPTLYKDDFPRQAFVLAMVGLTDKQMAQFFDVHVDTIDRWKRKYPEFSHALKEGKLVADAKVADALYNRALGYEVEEKTRMQGTDANGQEYDYTKTVKKHIPGDVKAMTFWLMNRMPEVWASAKRREQLMEQENKMELNYNNLDLTKYTPSEIRLLQAMAVKIVSTTNMEDVKPLKDE